MRRNKCHAFKSGIILFLSICSMVFAKPKYETSIDTFTVPMSEAEFDLSVIHWLKKIHGNVGMFSGTNINDDGMSSLLVTGLLRTGLLIQKKYDDSGALKIELTHLWNRGYRNISLYRVPNVTYTLKQELGFSGEAGQKITEKSYPVFLGLTLLNSGMGMGYASYKSPLSRENVPFTVLYALMDAALTVGLFMDDKGIRDFSLVFLPATKLAVCIRLGFIAEHNKFVKTGYRLILDR